MAKKWLVDIPLELRIMIYEHYFRSVKIRLHWLPGDGGVSRCDSNCKDRMLPRLLRVARQVKAEAYPVFFAQAVFKISECCCWWDSFHKYRTKPITFDRVQNITFALHEADFLRRFVLPGRRFKSICLRERRELMPIRAGETNTEKRFIKTYARHTAHFEYDIFYRMGKDKFFAAGVIVRNNARVILSYMNNNPPTKINEFEKNQLSELRRLYEDMGFDFDLGPLEKANLRVTTKADEERDILSDSSLPQSVESSVGCIVC